MALARMKVRRYELPPSSEASTRHFLALTTPGLDLQPAARCSKGISARPARLVLFHERGHTIRSLVRQTTSVAVRHASFVTGRSLRSGRLTTRALRALEPRLDQPDLRIMRSAQLAPPVGGHPRGTPRNEADVALCPVQIASFGCYDSGADARFEICNNADPIVDQKQFAARVDVEPDLGIVVQGESH